LKKIIVIELDKMLSWVEIKGWIMSYYTSFESLFHILDFFSNFLNKKKLNKIKIITSYQSIFPNIMV